MPHEKENNIKIKLIDLECGNIWEGTCSKYSTKIETKENNNENKTLFIFHKVDVHLTKEENKYKRSLLFNIEIDGKLFKNLYVQKCDDALGWLNEHMYTNKMTCYDDMPFAPRNLLNSLFNESDS